MLRVWSNMYLVLAAYTLSVWPHRGHVNSIFRAYMDVPGVVNHVFVSKASHLL